MGRSTGPDLETVMAVLHRDGYRCVRCDRPIVGERGVDWSCHHRTPRGMGGSKRPEVNSPAALLSLCGSGTTGCHGYVESHRAEALTNGWLVSRYSDPAAVAVLVDRGSRWVYLTESGYADDPPEEVA